MGPCLVLKFFFFSCFLVLQQGSAVSGISEPSSDVPALPPIGVEIIGDVSLSPSLINGTILSPPITLPPPISAPGTENSHSNGPTPTPPYNSDHPPGNSSGSVSVSSPSNNPLPEAPVPVGLPSFQSPPSPPASIPLIPLLEPPSADPNTPPAPISPAVNEPPPRIIPLPSPPVPSVEPVVTPPILPKPVAQTPSKSVNVIPPPPSTLLTEPLSNSSGDIAPTTSKPKDIFPPPEPTLPTEPPSDSSGNIAPTPSKSEDTFPPPQPTLPTEPPPNASGDISPTPSKSEDTFPPPRPTLPTEPPPNSSGDIAPTPSKSEDTFPPPPPTFPTEPPPNSSGDTAPTPGKSKDTFPPPQPTLPTEPPPDSSGDIAPAPSKSEDTFPPPPPTFPAEPPPNSSGDTAPTPGKSKDTFPPPQPTLPAEPPPNSSGDIAPTPSKSEDTFPPPQPTFPTKPPPNSSGDIAPTPSKSEDTFPPPQPTLPSEPPSSSSGEHNKSTTSSPKPVTIPGRAGNPVAAPPYRADGRPLPVNTSSPTHAPNRGTNPGTSAKPVAVPLNRTRNLHPSISPLPTNAPSSHTGKGNINRAPPPPLYSKSSPHPLQPPESAPSTSAQSPPKPMGEAPAPVSPRKEGDASPVPSSVPISPPQRTKVPVKSPEVNYSRSPTKFPKMPFQALPPPPPNQDCATLTCLEPLTNGPSGCLCVLPIQVGLRLGVALYTFFPLVSELAAEISSGDFLEQSQVRIMGANEASQDPGKTIVLTDLVPFGEKFDNITANLIFQRFWLKQVYIKNSLFGSYEVLYVRYPGLPPSPPAAPDIDVIANDPYHSHENSSRTTQPLGVDVGIVKHRTGPNKGVIAIIVLSASLAVIVFCAVLWVLLFKDRGSLFHPQKTPPAQVSSLAKSSGTAASVAASGPGSVAKSLGSSIAAYTGSMKTFSSSEIQSATDNFNEMRVIGEGGFGLVYRGVLSDGTEVAVKVLKRDDHQSGREFLAEVEMLSRLHHRNLVKLIGICVEEHSRCLVYELIPSGSVDSRLHDEGTAPLDWTARLKIALGAARGLAYLHEDSSPRVIHRDFKASNILLEDDYTPKVSDFGLAKAALNEDDRHISTRVMGTFGYVAPEYAMTGHLLVKSDVYSYGVVLLELLTGKKPVDMSQQPGQENLVSWARPLLTSKEGLELIIDQSLGPDFPLDSIAKVAAIASMCVQPEVSNRPFMGEVVQALKLVCNECEETRELGSRSCSREDISVDMDASSEGEVDPHRSRSFDSGHDVERGFSMSELLSSSQRSDRIDHESLRRHSSSGPLRSTNIRWPWQNMLRSSGGSKSEHHMMYKLWPRNR